jgi:translation initiation factor 3 subunit A
VLAAAEAKKREEEEKAAAIRKQREEERAAAAERARMQREREEEAEARARARAAEKAAERARPLAAAPNRVNNGPDNSAAWRRSTQPTASNSNASRTPPARTGSPSPAVGAQPKFKVGAAVTSQWRQREDARAAGNAPPRPASPAINNTKNEPKKDDDGFTTVPEKKVWKSKRLEGR